MKFLSFDMQVGKTEAVNLGHNDESKKGSFEVTVPGSLAQPVCAQETSPEYQLDSRRRENCSKGGSVFGKIQHFTNPAKSVKRADRGAERVLFFETENWFFVISQ